MAIIHITMNKSIITGIIMFFGAASLVYGNAPLTIPEPTAVNIQAENDTVVIIQSPEVPAPDDIYGDESVTIEAEGETVESTIVADTPEWLRSENVGKDLIRLGDSSHDVSIAEFAVPVGVFTAGALFVRTPALVKARKYVQKHLSQHGKHKTPVDDYIQYLPWSEPTDSTFAG